MSWNVQQQCNCGLVLTNSHIHTPRENKRMLHILAITISIQYNFAESCSACGSDVCCSFSENNNNR